DTNDVQMRLIEKLRDGRQSLFAVGDVKQSIYGFRGALGVIPRFARNDTELSLVDNYRSRSGIIAFVNEVGERFWGDDTNIENEKLSPKFDYEPHGTDPRVDVWFIEQPKIEGEDGKEKREPVDETREREGVAIANWIRDTVDGPNPLVVYDREASSYRPV